MPIPSEIPTRAESDKEKPWNEMIATLDPWQQDLLKGSTGIRADQNVEGLKELLQASNGELFLVSDGGCREEVAGYGFVVANATTGERLWKASGRVRGLDISAYRAEANGMLAAVVFIHMFVWYQCTNETTACKITHYCDNQSLVLETEWSRTWSETRDSLKPEYDLLKAIQAVASQKVKVPRYQRNKWVRGHQEDTTPYERLPLEAQMNAQADKLATQAIITSLKKDKFLNVITNPFCKAYL
jgi:hypothetical protein